MLSRFRKTSDHAAAHVAAAAFVLLTMTAAAPTFAYVGPGAGFSAIGIVLALFATLLLAVVGFVWYPIRRLRRRRLDNRPADRESETREVP